MSLSPRVRADVVAILQRPEPEGPQEARQLDDAFRRLAWWRSILVQNTFLAREGTRVMQGPLAGLDFLPRSAEGCHVPKLIGCYEQPLHAALERMMSEPYDRILNIGCAEGYYAVGFARRMAGTRILAFDLNEAAQKACADLADRNGVGERIRVGGLFMPADFATFAEGRTLVFCDIEGAEADLLDPVAAPALRGMDIVVEAHDCFRPGLSNLLHDRFNASHEIETILDDGHRALHAMPDWFRGLSHLDQLVAVWEFRSGPTPWLVMRARQRPA